MRPAVFLRKQKRKRTKKEKQRGGWRRGGPLWVKIRRSTQHMSMATDTCMKILMNGDVSVPRALLMARWISLCIQRPTMGGGSLSDERTVVALNWAISLFWARICLRVPIPGISIGLKKSCPSIPPSFHPFPFPSPPLSWTWFAAFTRTSTDAAIRPG